MTALHRARRGAAAPPRAEAAAARLRFCLELVGRGYVKPEFWSRRHSVCLPWECSQHCRSHVIIR